MSWLTCAIVMMSTVTAKAPWDAFDMEKQNLVA